MNKLKIQMFFIILVFPFSLIAKTSAVPLGVDINVEQINSLLYVHLHFKNNSKIAQCINNDLLISADYKGSPFLIIDSFGSDIYPLGDMHTTMPPVVHTNDSVTKILPDGDLKVSFEISEKYDFKAREGTYSINYGSFNSTLNNQCPTEGVYLSSETVYFEYTKKKPFNLFDFFW